MLSDCIKKFGARFEFHFKRSFCLNGLFRSFEFFSQLIGNSMYPAIHSNDKALIEYLTVSNYRVQK